MEVFVTGASGFIGVAIVREPINAGHQVIDLASSEKSAKAISAAGTEVLNCDPEDWETLKQGALQADGIVHTAFCHDFTQFVKSSEMNKNAVSATGEAPEKKEKPIAVTSKMLELPLINGFVTEDSSTQNAVRVSEVRRWCWHKFQNTETIRLETCTNRFIRRYATKLFLIMSKSIQHKKTFLTWLAIYPIITILLWLFGEYLLQIPLPLRTLVLTLVLVPLLSYVVLPFYNKIFSKWLNK
ncbi:MAG: NAD-dependent epimerase/dehydratase family protein [Chitinophagaceae bacterium]|nr:NAD-dependent epimerase/dehydratase family protein [Chitinophagaceae bacterium]